MFIKAFFYGIIATLTASSAFAITCANNETGGLCSNSQSGADCEALGYSIKGVQGCLHELHCPFNTLYTVCVHRDNSDAETCNLYPLASCPTGGICSSCKKGNTTTYKLHTCESCFVKTTTNGGSCAKTYQYDKCPTDAGAATCSECIWSGGKGYDISSCKEGYTFTGGSAQKRCVANQCNGYTLTSCPTNGICSSCKNGATNTIKYRLDSCKSGYSQSGNACIQVIEKKYTLHSSCILKSKNCDIAQHSWKFKIEFRDPSSGKVLASGNTVISGSICSDNLAYDGNTYITSIEPALVNRTYKVVLSEDYNVEYTYISINGQSYPTLARYPGSGEMITIYHNNLSSNKIIVKMNICK